MFCENVSERLGKCLFRASEEYFRDNLPDVSFPDGMEVTLQISRDPAHGDLTSNVAMRLASVIGKNPAVLGEGIIRVFRDRIKKTHLAPFIESVNLKSGFINFRLSDRYYSRTLTYIYGKRNDFGRSDAGRKKRINLEFVSANPTGPLTIAHGRQAAIGDALARILRFSGFAVTREYYLNDIGRQMRLLGESVGTRYRNLFGKNDPMPEDGYMGKYVEDIAKEIKTKQGDSLVADSAKAPGFFRDYALEYMMRLITKDLADFGVHFNVWTGQSSLEKHKEVEEVLSILKKNGYIYEKDGAQWFESTKYGDDKDRVVVKSDASYTYLAPDIAYHADKYRRGYTRLIDILGPDHHGYIKRMKAAVRALGYPEGSLNMLIAQLVTLMRDGRTISMSTRKGEFISLRELIDELGKDVTRFFFLSRRLDSHLDFDLELAKKESADNPVFYIQYAHAR
ncbi:MAG: arginine--tRNA ligase, partial [Candidatus Omnitrophota bacterium]